MELVPVKPAAGALVEPRAGAGSIPAMVAAQQEMLHAQVDQLRSLVLAQCRLTGVNPLAQEMAAGALSIKIGKKPRDLLNPKAFKSMQSLFALKDTIGKKETREISAFCGATVTQVREFFASQRTRVRKFVRLSREKALKIEASKVPDNVCMTSTEQTPLDIEAHAQVIEPLRTLEPMEVPQSCSQPLEAQQNPLQQATVQQNSFQQAAVQQNCSAAITPVGTMQQLVDVKINPDPVGQESKQDEVAPGVESEDKKFLESIFALMRKEETFSGQVKLMEWILQINNITILSWFLTMGGLTIVSTWLNQATSEEQTTVILVIFKVLLHLPLHKALPAHMSAVLQTINRLRFYRTQDISSRARNLLSRLSKVLVRSQALRKPEKNLNCKQRLSEIPCDESWKSEADFTEEILALTEGANEGRKPEPRKTPLLLTASAEESNKKSSLQTKSKEKRKVLLVEHPNRKAAGKNVHFARSISANNSRPLSADDIQKAKMRAMFLQEKYGKADTGKVIDKPQITENKKMSGLVNSNMSPLPRNSAMSITKQPVDASPSISNQSIVPLSDKPEILVNSKLNITCQENFKEKLDSKRVLWHIPPEVWLDPSWSVSAGDNSKELEVQTQRNRREKETFYASLKDIPLNPKDPWDVEMDFDDCLTPEIPIEQPPDADPMEADSIGVAPPSITVPVEDKQVGPTSSAAPAVAAGENGAASEPDLELLAVLLKNPQLVFALTSNQLGTLPSEQTVALLDMLKQTGLGLSELVNSLSNGAGVPKESETIPASLPSPTPPKDVSARSNWRSEFQTQAVPTNLQQPHLSNQRNTPIASTAQQSFANVASSLPSQPYAPVPTLPAHIQTNVPSLPQLVVSVNLPTQHAAAANNILNRAQVHQHTQSYALVSDPVAVPIHQQPAVNKRSSHELRNIPNPALAQYSNPERTASLPWQSSVANATTGRNKTPDPWATRTTTNSFNVASSNSVPPYPNQNAYSNQIKKSNVYNTYGSTPVSSHNILPGQGLDRNGYTHAAEYQTSGRGQQRQSRSPELGAGSVYGVTQGYNPEPPRQWDYGQKSYTPAESSSRHWSSGQQSYNAAEPPRRLAGRQDGYSVYEPSNAWSSLQQQQQAYTPGEQPRQWSSGHQVQGGQHPHWGVGKQDDYNRSDGPNSYDPHWR